MTYPFYINGAGYCCVMSIKKAPKLFKKKCILNVSDYVASLGFVIMKGKIYQSLINHRDVLRRVI